MSRTIKKQVIKFFIVEDNILKKITSAINVERKATYREIAKVTGKI